MKSLLTYLFIFTVFSSYANEPQVDEIFKKITLKEFNTLIKSPNFYYCSLSNKIVQNFLNYCDDFYEQEVFTSYHNFLSEIDKAQTYITKYYRSKANAVTSSAEKSPQYEKRDQSLKHIITLRIKLSKEMDKIDTLMNHKKLNYYFYDPRVDIIKAVNLFRNASHVD